MPENNLTTSAVLQPYHHGNLKEELLALALQQLNQFGPKKLSLRALAREAGVSQTAPYRHFEDKNQLLAALATYGFKQLVETSSKVVNDPLLSASEQLLSAGRIYINFALNNTELYRLMFGPALSPDDEYLELDAVGTQAFELMVDIISKGQARNEFVQQDALLVANTAWAMVHGMASLMMDRRYDCVEGGLNDVTVEEALKLMLSGIASAS